MDEPAHRSPVQRAVTYLVAFSNARMRAPRLRVHVLPGSVILLVLLLCASCDLPPDRELDTASKAEPPAGAHDAEAAPAAASAPSEAEIQLADSLANLLIGEAESNFQRLEPLSSREAGLFRRYSQADHLVHARRLGIDPVDDRRTAGERMTRPSAESGLVRLRTNAYYIVDPRMGFAVPLAVPTAAHLVERIGQRLQQDLRAEGLPPYRFILTNALRTGIDQAHLRGVNSNAARGESTHEYGTTFDLYYGRFHYSAAQDSLASSASTQIEGARARFWEELRRGHRRSGRVNAEKIKAVFGRTLLQMQEEGLLVAMYERAQPVFHVTAARAIESPPLHDDPSGEASAMHAIYANVESQLSDVDDDIEDFEEEAATGSGGANEGFEAHLSRLKEMRDMLWISLDRMGGLSLAEFRAARSQLQRRVADIEGQVVRTSLESVGSVRELQSRGQNLLQRTDRALDQLQAQIENAPIENRQVESAPFENRPHDPIENRPHGAGSRYEADVSELRSRQEALLRILQMPAGTSGAEFEDVRSQAADAAAVLVADLQVVVEEVNEPGA